MISVGDKFETNECGSCVVLEYKDAKNILVIFEDDLSYYETWCTSSNLKLGEVRNPFYPNIHGIGFVGVGKYSQTGYTRIYSCWNSMIQRCYSELHLIKRPRYKNCFVDERWGNFQNFAEDYLQMTGWDLDWQLDKDILIKGNKKYNKSTCCLVPSQINNLIRGHSKLSEELPIGVEFSVSKTHPYKARVSINGVQIDLNNFKTPELAFKAYKKFKEEEIKRVADIYKDQLDPKAYEALVNYTIDIND